MNDALPPRDTIGAFCRDNPVARKGYGKGPLTGTAFAVKDLFHIRGERTGFGHPDWLRTHGPAPHTARSVKRLLDAGADMVARAHCDELCYSLTGENSHYGTPENVNAPGRIPGGSSNGSAAAVAAKLVDFALGSDCGGSVRIPASYCGILGLRPTWGRVSLEGAVPFGPSFDVAGWFARDAALFEKVGRVLLCDRTTARPIRRVLIAKDAFAMVDKAVTEALQPSVDRICRLVGRSEEVTVSKEGLPVWFEAFRTIQAHEVWSNVGDWVSAHKPQLGPGVRDRLEWAQTVTPEMLAKANAMRAVVRARMAQLVGPGDVLCLPTSPRVAPPRNTPTTTLEIEYRHQSMCLLCIAGHTGMPQLTMPLAKLEGLPLGLSLVAPKGRDVDLLRFARIAMG